MKHLKSIFTSLFFLISLSLIVAVSVSAQPPGGDTGGDQSGGQMPGGMGQQTDGQMPGGMGQQGGMQMDAEQMQQVMAERYKELLGMGDEEWAVIGPYVLKVSELSQSSSQSNSGGMRMMMRGNMTGGPQGQGQNQQQSDQSEDQSANQNQRGNRGNMMGQQSGDENLEALQTLLEDENATSDEIKSKLATLRKTRETAKRELAAAQKELRELLTLRQEAMLVVMGLLE
jgi:hypothetical protein